MGGSVPFCHQHGPSKVKYGNKHSSCGPHELGRALKIDICKMNSLFFFFLSLRHMLVAETYVSHSVVSEPAHQVPLSMGFAWQNAEVGSQFLLQGGLPNPGMEPKSPALQADSWPSESPGKPHLRHSLFFISCLC